MSCLNLLTYKSLKVKNDLKRNEMNKNDFKKTIISYFIS